MTANKRSRAAFEADLQSRQSPYALYGTPLPPIDPEVRDDGSYVPVWKQEVTDERGRKRLHGAFTGGFSAGYFNTVGSKEGWTPATFVSSRQNRRKAETQQRPEDFMDEEDIRDEEDSKRLETAENFSGFSSTGGDLKRRAGLMDLLKTGGETIGTKLLKRMGWREGQGIGPKVRRKANVDDGGPTQDNGGETHLFAPENSPMIAFQRKNDHKGLGFVGETRLQSDIGPGRMENNEQNDDDDFDSRGPRITLKKKPKEKRGARRGGFGVGVLNDTGSDDEDPYEMGPQISYNRVIGPDKKKKNNGKVAENTRSTLGSANPLLAAKPVFISKKAAEAAKTNSGFRKCHDGRLPLDGFLLATRLSLLSMSSQDRRYAPPEIPKDWRSSKQGPTERDGADFVSTADAAKASSLDPKKRAALLGEAQLPGKSIFDYMTPEARERIVRLTGKTDLPPALGEKAPKGFEVSESQRQRSLWDLVPKLSKEVAVQALSRGSSGWMPYAEDEAKRQRYRLFLEVRAGMRSGLPDRGPGASTDDWINEMNEFARAAEVFKPVSGLMASRFTSSSSQPRLTSDAPDSTSPESLLANPSAKPEDPAVEAARIGMYGPMTRSTLTFAPARLLCKRFNVKPPSHVHVDPGEFPGSATASSASRFQSAGYQNPTATGSRLDLVGKDVMNQLLLESGGGTTIRNLESQETPPELALVETQEMVVDADRNEALEAERPGADVFKAIFGSDDEDDDD